MIKALLLLVAAAAMVPAAAVDSPQHSDHHQDHDKSPSPLNVSSATVVAGEDDIAATVLIEELEKRTGIRLRRSVSAVPNAPAIVFRYGDTSLPREGFRLRVEAPARVVSITGADRRGELYGAGLLLRRLDYGARRIRVPRDLDITTAPRYPIRGHQLGYRAHANTYDAWTVAQFDQYIRELTFFGINSVEGIPLQDDRSSPLMKVPRREMNRAIGEICRRYGLDYWAWIPAEFDLKKADLRSGFLERCNEFFHDTPELTGVFFPGGDPGDNPPELVIPFLEDMATRLRISHPRAKIWLSLQSFGPKQIDFVYDYIGREMPDWLGGLVAGPSSPPLLETRNRLPRKYGLRDYPDLTHNKLCQYQVPYWDQAFALTLGREAINPRAGEFALIHGQTAASTDGFISYSDGAHDDVNKTVWSALSWDPSLTARQILVDYARVYFNPDVAERAADGILALERNWRGPLVRNGAVEGTLLQWQEMERSAPELERSWRWQMLLVRASYDAYVRRRLIRETELEAEANGVLATARAIGAEAAMARATAILDRAADQFSKAALRARIFDLCDKLFHSIGLQTSVKRYSASGTERGAILDFVDRPLNNIWWMEDQFQAIRKLDSEAEKQARLIEIAKWEQPGAGRFYDIVGNIAKSPHVVRFEAETAPETANQPPEPDFWWWNDGRSRARLSWQVGMWPQSMVYEALEPEATYVLRCSGAGQALPRVNGERVLLTADTTVMGTQIKEFAVPARLSKSGKIVLTWDPAPNEEKLNWRQRSRLAEVWLIAK
jgi:hypothetical protein